jgi:hypothetical protein
MADGSYKENLNEWYRRTANVHALDGYLSDDAAVAWDHARRDYQALLELVAGSR